MNLAVRINHLRWTAPCSQPLANARHYTLCLVLVQHRGCRYRRFHLELFALGRSYLSAGCGLRRCFGSKRGQFLAYQSYK